MHRRLCLRNLECAGGAFGKNSATQEWSKGEWDEREKGAKIFGITAAIELAGVPTKDKEFDTPN